MMKLILFTSLVFLAQLANATSYVPVPEGHYTGFGHWTDTNGVAGKVTVDVLVFKDNLGLHNKFQAKFSDGRSYAGDAIAVFAANSNFTYVTNMNGQLIPVGAGVSGPDEYQISALALSKVEIFSEFGTYKTVAGIGLWRRLGSITNRETGRVTFLDVTEWKF